MLYSSLFAGVSALGILGLTGVVKIEAEPSPQAAAIYEDTQNRHDEQSEITYGDALNILGGVYPSVKCLNSSLYAVTVVAQRMRDDELPEISLYKVTKRKSGAIFLKLLQTFRDVKNDAEDFIYSLVPHPIAYNGDDYDDLLIQNNRIARNRNTIYPATLIVDGWTGEILSSEPGTSWSKYLGNLKPYMMACP